MQRISELKTKDPRRRLIGEFLNAWWEHHKTIWMETKNLDPSVKIIADPSNKGRQHLASFVARLDGTSLGGFRLAKDPSPKGKWTTTTFQLTRTRQDEG